MGEDYMEQWERFLTPQILRTTMITVSVFITTFELLKDSIIERIRDFYWTGYEEGLGDIIDPAYNTKVLSINNSPLYASLIWLKNSGAISEDDIAKFDIVKNTRNKMAHEINHLIMQGLPSDLQERFNDMVGLLLKIERWWIINVEIPTNPDISDKEIDENGIIPGPIASVRMMMDIALGTDKEAEYYINEFKNHGLISSRSE